MTCQSLRPHPRMASMLTPVAVPAIDGRQKHSGSIRTARDDRSPSSRGHKLRLNSGTTRLLPNVTKCRVSLKRHSCSH
jgi:hypothetical protein